MGVSGEIQAILVEITRECYDPGDDPDPRSGFAAMPVLYELLLRCRPSVPLPGARLLAALATRAATEGEGERFLVTRNGRVAVRVSSPEAGPAGIDLAVPAAASGALAEDLCAAAFDLAKELDLQVFDPQLGRLVTVEETDSVVARLRQQNVYYTETVGIDPVDGGLRSDHPAPGITLTGRGKFYLLVGGFIAILALLAQLC